MTSLKQISPEKRITFLKKFTTEVIINLVKEIHVNQKIEQEKIKQKILSPIKEPIITISPVFQLSKFTQVQKENSTQGIIEISPMQNQRTVDIEQLRKPIQHRTIIPRKIPIQMRRLGQPLQKPSQQIQKKPISPDEFQASKQILSKKTLAPQKISIKEKVLRETKPEAKPRPAGFALGKIESLLRNKEIQLIECPGPNKNLLVKKYNKINTTRITLNQAEITDILYSFAKEAQIPVVGGILKAAVGDLVVSAVISEFVGSRFIINKLTPYSLIQK